MLKLYVECVLVTRKIQQKLCFIFTWHKIDYFSRNFHQNSAKIFFLMSHLVEVGATFLEFNWGLFLLAPLKITGGWTPLHTMYIMQIICYESLFVFNFY